MTSNFRTATRRVTPTTLVGLTLAAVLVACSGQAAAVDPVGQGSAPTAVNSSPVAMAPEATPADGSTDPVNRQAPMATPRAYAPGPPVPHVDTLQPPAFASRIVVDNLGIDLPVVSGDLQPPPSYPLCDVAAYVTLFGQPYEDGITYISAHAQRGMFAPLLAASKRNDGQEMLGMQVSVYTSDGRRFDYTVNSVFRHRVDYSIVDEIPLDERTLIMQTSEGVYGTIEKLQVVASFVSETPADLADANPEPHPRNCDPGAS
jgi:hypothetical protein